MKVERVNRVLLWVVLVCGVAMVVVIGGAFWLIGQEVETLRARAQEAHPRLGDDVGALVAYMESDEHSWHERNRAVWALGRLSDPCALPALLRAYNGGCCDHEVCLCQYELAKAINRCGGVAELER